MMPSVKLQEVDKTLLLNYVDKITKRNKHEVRFETFYFLSPLEGNDPNQADKAQQKNESNPSSFKKVINDPKTKILICATVVVIATTTGIYVYYHPEIVHTILGFCGGLFSFVPKRGGSADNSNAGADVVENVPLLGSQLGINNIRATESVSVSPAPQTHAGTQTSPVVSSTGPTVGPATSVTHAGTQTSPVVSSTGSTGVTSPSTGPTVGPATIMQQPAYMIEVISRVQDNMENIRITMSHVVSELANLSKEPKNQQAEVFNSQLVNYEEKFGIIQENLHLLAFNKEDLVVLAHNNPGDFDHLVQGANEFEASFRAKYDQLYSIFDQTKQNCESQI